MSNVLQIQILVYMVIIAGISFTFGYSRGRIKGHREGYLQGRDIARVAINKMVGNK